MHDGSKMDGSKEDSSPHSSYSKVDKKWALETSARLFGEVLKEADSLGLGDIMICPEVLGKNNQIGSLDEIIEMCRTNERLSPTIDFAHIHARGQGSLNSVEDFERVINMLENSLGTDRVRELHCHFSRLNLPKVARRSTGISMTHSLDLNLNIWPR